MRTRRALLAGFGGLALAGVSYGVGGVREARRQSETRLFDQSTVIDTSAGPLEYAVAGHGPPLMMIHGTGGGFDQGLLFGGALRDLGFSIVAPSRFGYLRSAFPDDASPAYQADVLIELLDHLGIDRVPVIGGSAGALTAAEVSLRHPDRCSQLCLLVPAANLTGSDPVVFTPVQQIAANAVLGSDAWFWALSRLSPGRMIEMLLATDPALLDQVSPEERRRAQAILAQIFPISRKILGLRNDGIRAGSPSRIAFDLITAPTLILSCEDDLFGTAGTSRLLAEHIADARLRIYPSGGHIWLGRNAEIAAAIAAFIRNTDVLR